MDEETGLTNEELNEIAEKSNIKLDDILPEDEIEKLPNQKIEENKYYIINTSRINQNEKVKHHWYAFVLEENPDTIMIFDSLGLSIKDDPEKEKLYQIIKERSKTWYPDYIPVLKENLIKKESDNSTACGLFSLEFLKRIQKGESFKKASEFDEETKEYEDELMEEHEFEIII